MAKMLLASANEETIDAVRQCLKDTSHYLWTLQKPIGLDTVLGERVNPSHVLIYDVADVLPMLTVLSQSTYDLPIAKVGLLDGADFFGDTWHWSMRDCCNQFLVPKPLDHDVLQDALLRAAQAAYKAEEMGRNINDGAFVVEAGPISTLCDPTPIGRRKTRVLIANDDLVIARLSAVALERTGHYAATASRGGAETLDLLTGGKNRFDVLVSDIVNPYMRGGNLVERALRIRPELSVVISSHIWDVMDEMIEIVQSGHASAVVPTGSGPLELVSAIEEVLRLKSAGAGPGREVPQKHWWSYRRHYPD